jgi:type I restriction enzyme S subunit
MWIETYKQIKIYTIVSDDVYISIAGTIGLAGIIPPELNGANLTENAAKLCNLRNVDKKFLAYILNSEIAKPQISALIGKATQPKLALFRIEKINIPLPPLLEQRRIAEVLGTVDSAIQSVGGAIESTERLKKGLMQRLLMRGIGHERFKESEVGRVPEEWEVARLGDAVEINRESRDPTRENPDGKFLYIDIESVVGGTGAIKSAKEIFGKDAPSRARRIIHQNDVIMSTVRPYLKAFALVPREYNNQICSTGFAVLSCKDEILQHYLLYTIFSKMVIDQCNKMMMGGQYPALNQSQVAKIEIPLPLLPEQRRIAEILSAADRKLELERRRKEKLERVKQGLMNDLLTGRKRIKINV